MKTTTSLSLLFVVPAVLGGTIPHHHRHVARQYGYGGYGGGGGGAPEAASTPAAANSAGSASATPTPAPKLFAGAQASGIGVVGVTTSSIGKDAVRAAQQTESSEKGASGGSEKSASSEKGGESKETTKAGSAEAGSSTPPPTSTAEGGTGKGAAAATSPPARFVGAKASGIGVIGIGSSVIAKEAVAKTEAAQGISATTTAAAAAASGSQAAASSDPNVTVLQFALQLEKLETEFYTQALKRLSLETLQKAGFSKVQAKIMQQQMATQLFDEEAHVKILESTLTSLGQKPFSGCSFNLDAALTDPLTTISVARTVEAIGVGAYQGGAQLLQSAQLLEAAASILPIEARHQSALNLFAGGSLSPQAFDIALTPPQVLALAGGFLKDCKASDLGLKANAPLSVIDSSSKSTLFAAGSVLQFQTSAEGGANSTNDLSCQMISGQATEAIVLPASKCIVPDKMNGPVAIYLTSSKTPLQANVAAQDASSIVAGPALVFVDSGKDELFPQLFADSATGLTSIPSANLGAAGLLGAGKTNEASAPPMFSWGNKKPRNSARM